MSLSDLLFFLFSCNGPATTEIYTLSLHDALPIYWGHQRQRELADRLVDQLLVADVARAGDVADQLAPLPGPWQDRKSTRLNSSHEWISYAVFCLKKKKNANKHHVNLEANGAIKEE